MDSNQGGDSDIPELSVKQQTGIAKTQCYFFAQNGYGV